MTTRSGAGLYEADHQSFHESLSYAWGEPDIEATFKAAVDDFEVDEVLGWSCSGDGEHLCLLVRKRGLNTADVARRLARGAGIPAQQIGFAGMKDRHGICRQWFSLHLPGRADPDFDTVTGADLVIEEAQRNNRKIRRGSHRGNLFRIRLRDVRDPNDTLEERLHLISSQGVPNYFGEQRFGWQAGNIGRAMDWFDGRCRPKGRNERGLLLSTARSVIFNAVLSRRVDSGNWNGYLEGDVMNLSGTASVFRTEPGDETDSTLNERLSRGDIHPTGPLWGRGELPVTARARSLEQNVAEQYPVLAQGVCREGASQARRSLRLLPEQLHYARSSPGQLQLSFTLPSGAYASAVLRELCKYSTRQLLENDVS